MQRVYVSLKKENGYQRNLRSTLVIVLSLIIFVFVAFFMRGAFNDQREELIEKLKRRGK